MESQVIILKVGGSILSKSEEKLFDFEVAQKLVDTLVPLTASGYKFILSCGGGYICRKYQNIVRESKKYGDLEEHLIGTETCNINATMMKIVLGDKARDMILALTELDSDEPIHFDEPFLVVGAARPGHSSDTDAVLVAKRTKSSKIISLKNVDGVYSEDPKKNSNAQKFDSMTWEEYRALIGTEIHTPGGHLPVDPIASKLAEDGGISFVILDGEDLKNLQKALIGDSFIGTTIY